MCFLCIRLVHGLSADTLILYPTTRSIAVSDSERLRLRGDCGSLDVWIIRSPGAAGRTPQAYVLELYGVGGRAEVAVQEAAKLWGLRPVEIWSVNYPGYGESAGPATLASIPPAVLRAYDALADRSGGRPIFIEGESLGTTAALYAASERAPAGLILRDCPPLRSLILGHYGWWNLWAGAAWISRQIPKNLDSLQTGKRAHAPAVFVVSDDDQVVPPPYQERVIAAYGGRKKQIVRVAGAGHGSPISGGAAIELQARLDWLWQSANLELSKTIR